MSSSDEGASQVSGYRAPEPDQDQALLLQRWTYLRELLIRQLERFEHGGLTLRSNTADVSGAAVTDLKASILEFDALILGTARARP